MRYSKTLLTFEGQEGSHPSEDDLEEFVFGRMAGDELDAIEEHLLLCDSCRRRLSEVENFVASTRAAARKMLGAPPPTPKPRRFSAPAWAWAAAFGVLLLAVGGALAPRFRAAQSVELIAERGVTQGQATAGRPLDLRLDAKGLEARWLEVVNSRGVRLHAADVQVSDGRVLHRAPALPAGQAWVRLYARPSPAADTPPLREYSLLVQ